MAARPGIQRGKDVPDPHRIKALLKDPKRMQEYAESSRKWVQESMADDAKKLARNGK
jgi:glutathione S-transferase